ncbi:LysR substrate-binding domain-containing protein [Aureimonas populi]|uniref:LysR substrate-binding domain-containing protein n=1 Tax=Aureimonas populi TaxID=1701758 RepID=A0ABW5CP41_9HYPH|nr:LysR substrate-binding domain-containing protein [Aureimonas populi]
MNLRQLKYFIAVAEELHFGRAAERLGMAQPPLSRQIRELEAELGTLLFNRGRNAITLTLAGQRLYERGGAVLKEVADILLEVRRIGQGAEGRLRIGFVGSATFGILPTIVKSFRMHYPDVVLSLMPMNNADLHQALVRRSIDIAFARPMLPDAEFLTRQLDREDLIVAMPDGVAPDTRGPVTLAAIAHLPLILYPEFPRPSYADLVIARLEAQGHDTSRRVFTMDLQTALSLVAIGEGVCVVPESVGSAHRNGIRYRRVSPALGVTELSLSHRIDEQGIHVHHFARIAQEVARRMVRAR